MQPGSSSVLGHAALGAALVSIVSTGALWCDWTFRGDIANCWADGRWLARLEAWSTLARISFAIALSLVVFNLVLNCRSMRLCLRIAAVSCLLLVAILLGIWRMAAIASGDVSIPTCPYDHTSALDWLHASDGFAALGLASLTLTVCLGCRVKMLRHHRQSAA